MYFGKVVRARVRSQPRLKDHMAKPKGHHIEVYTGRKRVPKTVQLQCTCQLSTSFKICWVVLIASWAPIIYPFNKKEVWGGVNKWFFSPALQRIWEQHSQHPHHNHQQDGDKQEKDADDHPNPITQVGFERCTEGFSHLLSAKICAELWFDCNCTTE